MKKLPLLDALVIASSSTAQANTEYWSSFFNTQFCPSIGRTEVCSAAETWVNFVQALTVGSISVFATFSGPDYQGYHESHSTVGAINPFTWKVRASMCRITPLRSALTQGGIRLSRSIQELAGTPTRQCLRRK